MPDSNKLSKIRHSAEHVLTQAMQNLYPGKFLMAMGPATSEGFYFDFEPLDNFKISETEFPKIEAEMKKIINQDLPITHRQITLKQAKNIFKKNPYKLEWLKQIKNRHQKISVYSTGNQFIDLCAGPHVKSTGQIGAVKLLSVAGAYWHGDEKNKMLTRIYGTAFASPKELNNYLKNLEEAKKRDHRQIGKNLDLFSFHPQAPGDVFWHHKGYIIMKLLFDYWRQIHQQQGYQEIRTPEILTKQIWQQSGHANSFVDKMYRVLSPKAKKWDMAIKPMNCDGGILIYKNSPKSYKDLPLKLGELGIVHRFEASGEIHGIIRPREFTQDDAHIYCTPNQVKDEIKKVIDLCLKVYNTFGIKVDHLELSTRPPKSIGSDEIWQKAEKIMHQILKEVNIPHQVNPGEGAFYGPKFDFHLKDSLNRTWQCATIQLDFAQPQNFNLEYTDKNGNKKQPVMIHRVVYGSVERFLGILIENYAGAFPVWLAPVQVEIIPITDNQIEYAQSIKQRLDQASIRSEIDSHSETMQNKIRQASQQKIPFMAVIGPREVKTNTVAIRQRDGQNLGPLPVNTFLVKMKQLIDKKSLTLLK